jgi:hypothetical protein
MNQPLVNFFKKYLHTVLLGLIIVVYLFNGIHYLKSQSITSDEGSFMHYAIRYLKGHPERVYPRTDNSKMPVSILNTIPRVVEHLIQPGLKKSDWGYGDIFHGRYVTLIISVFTILLVFVWGKELYGVNAGLFSALLMSVCPNNLANAALVTTDAYSVLFLLLSMYLLWKFCRYKSNRYFLLLSIAVALSQLVKQSLFHLYVLLPICMLVLAIVQKDKFHWGLFLKRVLLFSVVNIFIINAGYYFQGSFTRLGDYRFMSHLFQSVQQLFPSSLPLPFPKPFTDGLDMAKYYDQVGGGIDKVSSFGKVTILGESRTGSGIWYYYFVSIFYKTPVAYFILYIWSSIILLRQQSFRNFMKNEFFLLLPVAYFLLLMSFLYQTQCGIRHIVFIYPFIFILSGVVMNYLQSNGARIVTVLSLLYLLISVGRYRGNYIPYTNEFILDKKMAYTKVGASNLEFLQGGYFALDYLSRHTEVKWAPKQPEAGRFIISVEDYMDIWNRHQYDWIANFKPVVHVAYNYLLIDVDEKNLYLPGNKPSNSK